MGDTLNGIEEMIEEEIELQRKNRASEVSSAGLLSGVEVERLFLLAILHTFNTDQVAAVTKYYVEELRPNAKEVLAQFKPDNVEVKNE